MYRPAIFGPFPTRDEIFAHRSMGAPTHLSRWLAKHGQEVEVLRLGVVGDSVYLISADGAAIPLPQSSRSAGQWLALHPETFFPTAIGEPSVTWHKRDIPKGVLGEVSKIHEELAELEDALEQDVRVMAQVEAADIVGAVGAFTQKHFGTSLLDLVKMSEVTARARGAHEHDQ